MQCNYHCISEAINLSNREHICGERLKKTNGLEVYLILCIFQILLQLLGITACILKHGHNKEDDGINCLFY